MRSKRTSIHKRYSPLVCRDSAASRSSRLTTVAGRKAQSPQQRMAVSRSASISFRTFSSSTCILRQGHVQFDLNVLIAFSSALHWVAAAAAAYAAAAATAAAAARAGAVPSSAGATTAISFVSVHLHLKSRCGCFRNAA